MSSDNEKAGSFDEEIKKLEKWIEAKGGVKHQPAYSKPLKLNAGPYHAGTLLWDEQAKLNPPDEYTALKLQKQQMLDETYIAGVNKQMLDLWHKQQKNELEILQGALLQNEHFSQPGIHLEKPLYMGDWAGATAPHNSTSTQGDTMPKKKLLGVPPSNFTFVKLESIPLKDIKPAVFETLAAIHLNAKIEAAERGYLFGEQTLAMKIYYMSGSQRRVVTVIDEPDYTPDIQDWINAIRKYEAENV